MSRDNGQVTGSTRILDNGSNASRFNLVLLAEGFTADQQDAFNDRCDEFVAALQSDKWLRGLAAAINVHRINVESDEEGTDDPDDCDGGDDNEADTFFDSSLCTGLPAIRRLMHFDGGLAAETCDQEVPEWDVAIAVVNSDKYGGAGGGRIAITTTSGDWTSVSLHELGHSAFGLADEYEMWSDCNEEGHDHPLPGLEPWEPNVTRALHGWFFELATSAEHVKWGHLIASSTTVPTLRNGNCADCNAGANPLSTNDEIGLFEGAQYYHCDLFRPAFDCRMRNSETTFCFVCIEAAHRVLRPYLPDGARVVAEIDDVDMGDVCSGATRTTRFRIANLGTVFGEVKIETTIGQLQADVQAFGVPAGTLFRDGGLIPGQAARVTLTFGPLDLPSTETQRDIAGEIRVLVEGDIHVMLPFRVSVHTPRAVAQITPASLLDFGDVAVPLTMYRRLRIGNVAEPCALAMDVIVDELTNPFRFPDTIDDHLDLSIAGGEAKDVYVQFTASGTVDTIVNGTLRLRTSDPNVAQLTIDLRARVVAPAPVDTVLVIDRSGSMSGETGETGRQKIDHAIFAVDLYTSLLRDDDRIGLVRFNQHATEEDGDLLVDLTVAAGGGREAVRDVLAQGAAGPLHPSGNTSVGEGLLLASATLDAAASAKRAILVLTDGRENRGTTIEEAKDQILTKDPPQQVFAVGFGLDQLTESIVSATTVTGGFALVTGDVVGDKEFLLQKLFVQILSDEAGWSMVVDPVHRIARGESARTRIRIGETDLTADFIVVFRPDGAFPKYLRTWLKLPDGTIVTPQNVGDFPGATYVERGNHLFYRVTFPVVPDPRAHLGEWEAWVANDADVSDSVEVTAVMARAFSNLRLEGRLSQHRYEGGSPMTITLRPILFGMPAQAHEPVKVRAILPDGQRCTLSLHAAQPGVYCGVFRDTQQVGPYHFDCAAVIRTPSGIPVTRSRYLGGAILPPPKHKPKEPKRDDWERLEELLAELLRLVRSRTAVLKAQRPRQDGILRKRKKKKGKKKKGA